MSEDWTYRIATEVAAGRASIIPLVAAVAPGDNVAAVEDVVRQSRKRPAMLKAIIPDEWVVPLRGDGGKRTSDFWLVRIPAQTVPDGGKMDAQEGPLPHAGEEHEHAKE